MIDDLIAPLPPEAPEPKQDQAAKPPATLPELREDIQLHKGPRNSFGAQTWTLHDPSRNMFLRIGWVEFEILAHWSMKDPEKIIAAIHHETRLDITPEQIQNFVGFLARHNLLKITQPQAIDNLYKMKQGQKKSIGKWLLHNYLFFRIPLVKPDRFLTRTYPYISFIYTRRFFWLIFVVTVLGLFLVARQWDQFTKTFLYFFSLQGLIFYALALSFTKIIHELGHAYTCKRYGLKVPTMGMAFLVLWPVLYTDTTDSWKLSDRHERVAIGLAGMASELILAAFAILLWSFLPDGPWRSAVFLVGTITWITTVILNINPCMRFDGYYILSDYWDIHNLQQRSFALGRWWLRKTLFGFKNPPPEHFPPKRQRSLIIYAFATWIYRFFLFLGIALLVYYFFFKALGIFLMVVEILWFIVLPIYHEIKAWWAQRKSMTLNRHTIILASLVGLFILLFIIPWRQSIYAPALLHYQNFSNLFPQVPAQLVDVAVKNGDQVKENQSLFIMKSPKLNYDIEKTQLKIDTFEWQLSRQAADQTFLAQSDVVEKELASAMSEYDGYLKMRDQLIVRAPFDGTVVDIDPTIKKGRWVNVTTKLGIIVNMDGQIIEAYVDEKTIRRVKIGSKAKFIPDNQPLETIICEIISVDDVSTSRLEEPYLASDYGGEIAGTHNEEGEFIPKKALYRIVLRPVDKIPLNNNLPTMQVQRGTVVLFGEAESLLVRAWRATLAIFIRESGF